MPTRNFVLSALGAELDLLKPHLRHSTLQAGEVVNELGRPVTLVCFPTGGLVSSCLPFEDGDHVECLLRGRNGAVGLPAALGISATPLARDICLVSGQAWMISVRKLRAVMVVSPRIREEIEACCLRQMSYALRQGACNAKHHGEQRVARWLLSAVDILGGSEIQLSQEIVAGALSIRRSFLNPILRRFQAMDLIAIERGKLLVRDYVTLQKLACECQHTLQRWARAAPFS